MPAVDLRFAPRPIPRGLRLTLLSTRFALSCFEHLAAVFNHDTRGSRLIDQRLLALFQLGELTRELLDQRRALAACGPGRVGHQADEGAENLRSQVGARRAER